LVVCLSKRHSPARAAAPATSVVNFFAMKQRGFTLIELLLYIGLAGAILLAVSIFLSIILASQVKNRAINEVEQQGRQIILLLEQAISDAQAINSPATGVSAPSLSITSIEPLVNPVVFNLSGGKIRIIEGANSPVELNSNQVIASALSFVNLSRPATAGLVRFSFTLQYLNDNNRQELNYAKTFYGSLNLKK